MGKDVFGTRAGVVMSPPNERGPIVSKDCFNCLSGENRRAYGLFQGRRKAYPEHPVNANNPAAGRAPSSGIAPAIWSPMPPPLQAAGPIFGDSGAEIAAPQRLPHRGTPPGNPERIPPRACAAAMFHLDSPSEFSAMLGLTTRQRSKNTALRRHLLFYTVWREGTRGSAARFAGRWQTGTNLKTKHLDLRIRPGKPV